MSLADDNTIRAVAVPCHRCGGIIDVISPSWLELVFEPDGSGRVIDFRPDDASALCVRCALETTAESNAHLLPKLARRTRAHVPDGWTVFHQRTQERRPYKRTQAVYIVEFSFLWMAEEPARHGDMPLWAVTTPQGVNFLLLLSLDLFMDGAPVAAHLTWDMAQPDAPPPLVLSDWLRTPHADVMRLMTVFQEFYRRRRGRPPGSTDRSLDDYVAAFRAATTKLGKKPRSLDEFSDLAGIPRDTVRRNLKRWGTTWGRFKREQPGS